MITPPGRDMPRWPANILICWGLSPNTAPPRIHPQENGHTNCGTCHGILLSHKERITGTRVNMDRWQTQYAEWNQLGTKSTHYVFLLIRKSTAGKANLWWLTSESGWGEGELFEEGPKETFWGNRNVLYFVLDGGYAGIFNYQNSGNWTLKICGFYCITSMIIPQIK